MKEISKKKIQVAESELDIYVKGIGQRIKMLRKERNISAEAFADIAGIHRSQYGRYENGKDLRYSSIRKIVKALGITIQQFFEGME